MKTFLKMFAVVLIWSVAWASSDLDFLETQCFLGQMPACFKLGVIEKKNGNMEQAKRLYRQACDQKYFKACTALGITERDQGDIDEAKKLFQLACDGKRMCPVPHTLTDFKG